MHAERIRDWHPAFVLDPNVGRDRAWWSLLEAIDDSRERETLMSDLTDYVARVPDAPPLLLMSFADEDQAADRAVEVYLEEGYTEEQLERMTIEVATPEQVDAMRSTARETKFAKLAREAFAPKGDDL